MPTYYWGAIIGPYDRDLRASRDRVEYVVVSRRPNGHFITWPSACNSTPNGPYTLGDCNTQLREIREVYDEPLWTVLWTGIDTDPTRLQLEMHRQFDLFTALES